MSYPDEIIVVKGSPEYKVLSHSEFFTTLAENWTKNNEVKLSSKFFGDEWPMFVDLFFPEMGYNPLFMFRNGSIQVIPNRGKKEDLAKLMDFLLVDDEKTMMNFARNQARKQLNAPASTVPRGKGTRRNWTNERKRGNSIIIITITITIIIMMRIMRIMDQILVLQTIMRKPYLENYQTKMRKNTSRI